MEGTGIIIAIIIVIAYFIPTIIASKRDTINVNAVFVINLFLGWTFIGWVVALAMGAGGQKKEAKNERY